MRLLFECTYVFDNPHVNSGIQRVVRNVIKNLGGTQEAGVECLPVILRNDKIHEVRRLAPEFREHILSSAQAWFETSRNRHWLEHHHLEQRLGLKRFPALRRAVEGAFRFATLWFILPFGLTLLALSPHRIHARTRPMFERCRDRYWLMHQRLEQRLGLSRWRPLRWLFWQACRGGSLTFILPWKLFGLISREDLDQRRTLELECHPGDVLVLLDSSWHADFFTHVDRLKAAGVGVVAVVYDLIPLTHPQFCDGPLVKVFDRWFEWVANTADGFIAISETISHQVRADVVQRLGQAEAEAEKRWYSFFHLGSELDQTNQSEHVRQSVRSLFAGKPAIYLMVSTIEPRKNHAYLLDAFEQLWATDSPVILCIVGRIGWKCAPLIERIKKHAEFGRRLFMFNDLNDTELEFCYQKGRALVFPSFVEGFGLPLVEAMQRGLPAMASDIPVFREIGDDFLAYFDLDDPATLAGLVRKFEDSGKFPAARALDEWSWPGWRDATRQLIQRIARNTLERRPDNHPAVSIETLCASP